MVTLGAAEKPDFTLICRPELTKPPDCKVVLALGAFDLDGGHGFCLAFLLNDHDLVFAARNTVLHLIGVINLPDIPAFPAFQLAPRRNKHALAFRTEHRYNNARAEKINPLIVRNNKPVELSGSGKMQPLQHSVKAGDPVFLQNPFFGFG
jgi:hypothetical protein